MMIEYPTGRYTPDQLKNIVSNWILLKVPGPYVEAIQKEFDLVDDGSFFTHLEARTTGVNVFSWYKNKPKFWAAVQELWAEDPSFPLNDPDKAQRIIQATIQEGGSSFYTPPSGQNQPTLDQTWLLVD